MGRSQGTNVPVWVRRVLLGPQWAAQPRSENVDRRISARLSSAVAGGITLLFAVIAALPETGDDRTFVMFATLVPVAGTLAYVTIGPRLPWIVSDIAAVGAAVTLVALMNHAGPLAPALPAIYLLLGTSVMAMRTPPAAAFHVATFAASYGLGLWLTEAPQPLVRWATVLWATLACGTFVRLLMSTVLALTYDEKRARAEAERTAVALEEASAEKTEFLSRMSHELRTPLNAILGFGDVLLHGYGGDLGDRQREYVDEISSAGHHLLDLVDEVLDVSMVESGDFGLHLSTVELGDVVRGAAATVEVLAEQAHVSLRVAVESSERIQVDERRIGQVLLNLLSNGVRFAGRGGEVAVHATTRDGLAVVRVEDTGPGIAPESRERIFEPYQQADGVVDGTGLGLAVSRRLVEAHGGELRLGRDTGRGAVFICEIPIATRTGTNSSAPDDSHDANPYDAFTTTGSPANNRMVARAGTWFGICFAAYATTVSIVADASWITRMGFAGCAVIGGTIAYLIAENSHRVTAERIEVLRLFGAVVLCSFCYFARDFQDIAILPLAWITLTVFSLGRGRHMLRWPVVIGALYALVLISGPDDPMARVRWVALIFCLAMTGIVGRVLVEELSGALADERQARSRTEDLRRRVEAATRHKSEFLASMSHELRTPLNAILGFADVLVDGYAGPLDDRQRAYVDDIRDAGTQLLSLINDILELARIEAHGRPRDLEHVPLLPLVGDAVDRRRADAVRREVAIDLLVTSAEPRVLGDPRALALAVDKLIANAVKFSPDGASVEVRLGACGSRITLEVSDRGIGIKQAQLPHVFEPFHQGSEPLPPHARGGTGLGLALALGVAQIHGGSLDARSRVGEGSTFTLELPSLLTWVPTHESAVTT